jgi:hypothetical protein
MEENVKKSTLVLAVFSSLMLLGSHCAKDTNRIYVDAENTHPSPDGSSWAKAFPSLQDALDAAESTPRRDDIWIAEGTYRPSRVYTPSGESGGQYFVDNPGSAPDNLKTFHLPGGVHLYGGFKAGARSLGQRRPLVYETILDGDLDGNDPADLSDNAWHVLIAGNDVDQTGIKASLHTLTVKNGRATGPTTPLDFSNANFRYTHDYGGAMVINFNSEILLERMKFVDNWADGDGGALFYNNSDVTVARSHFENNGCGFRGGAIEAFSLEDEVGDETGITNMLITDSTFVGNSAGVFGGAIVGEGTFASQDSSLTIEKSYFSQNEALEGGAIVIDSLNVLIDRTEFHDNYAEANAGALATTSVVEFLAGGSSLFTTTVTDSSFVANHALGDSTTLDALLGVTFASGGGAVVTYLRGILEVDGCEFLDNSTLLGEGGALLNGDAVAGGGFIASVETTVSKSRFLGNSAVDGGAIASKSLIGLDVDGFDGRQNVLDLSDSKFDDNYADGLGGALYLDGAVAGVTRNLFKSGNEAGLEGDQIYATGSVVNGIESSSEPEALGVDLLSSNVFAPLMDGALKLE